MILCGKGPNKSARGSEARMEGKGLESRKHASQSLKVLFWSDELGKLKNFKTLELYWRTDNYASWSLCRSSFPSLSFSISHRSRPCPSPSGSLSNQPTSQTEDIDCQLKDSFLLSTCRQLKWRGGRGEVVGSVNRQLGVDDETESESIMGLLTNLPRIQ